MNVYDKGDEVTITAQFSNPTGGAPVSPSTVVATITKGKSGVTVPVTMTESPTGTFTGVYTILDSDPDGLWWYAVDGTGGFAASQESPFGVREQEVSR